MGLKEFKELALAGKAAEGVLLRKQFVLDEVRQVEGEERVLQFTISTGVVDRDEDTISPAGWKLDDYKKNPVVLWAHIYDGVPVARALVTWIEDDKLKSRAEFTSPDLYPFGFMIYRMYKEGFLNATSVGFMPEKWQFSDDRKWGVDFLEQALLEYSCVPVPANPEALIEARSKGIDTAPLAEWAMKTLDGHNGEAGLWVPRKQVEQIVAVLTPRRAVSVPAGTGEQAKVHAPVDVEIQRILPLERKPKDAEDEHKGVIAYKETPLAPEDEGWDGPAEVAAAEVEDLKVMCTWFDSENPDVKQSYKLPHHKAAGRHACVWRGVAAATAALLGGRGGVNIPDDDRKGCYSHLAKHYADFDKEPPEFRSHTEEEIRALFPEVAGADAARDGVGAGEGAKVSGEKDGGAAPQGPESTGTGGAAKDGTGNAGPLLQDRSGAGTAGHTGAVADIPRKSGRVLSRANEERIRQARDVLDEVLAQLESDDGEEGDGKGSPSSATASVKDNGSAPSGPAGNPGGDGDELVLELADDEAKDEAQIEVESLKQAVCDALKGEIERLVSSVRGRVD